jgi:NAD(P)H-hydrate epimerase
MAELAGFHMVALFRHARVKKNVRIAVVCGSGGKARDGLAAARHLVNHGYRDVSVVLVTSNLAPSAAAELGLVRTMKISSYRFSSPAGKRAIRGADFIIDALIGYHLKGAPRGAFRQAIEAINASRGKVVAYDLPSGADPNTGSCPGVCVQAEFTLALAIPKRLFQTWQGRALSGKAFVGDIGIPAPLYEKVVPRGRPAFREKGLVRLKL